MRLVLSRQFRVDEFEHLAQHAVLDARIIGISGDVGDDIEHAFAKLAHALGKVFDLNRSGLGQYAVLGGGIEPGVGRLRSEHKTGMFTAEFFVGQPLVPVAQVLDVLRTSPAPAVQAENERVGFAGVEVDGLHQAILNALELAGLVEGEGLGGDAEFGRSLILS